jgi:hypothetical protein
MTSVERMYHLYNATRYLSRAKVPSDMLECGVWRAAAV